MLYLTAYFSIWYSICILKNLAETFIYTSNSICNFFLCFLNAHKMRSNLLSYHLHIYIIASCLLSNPVFYYGAFNTSKFHSLSSTYPKKYLLSTYYIPGHVLCLIVCTSKTNMPKYLSFPKYTINCYTFFFFNSSHVSPTLWNSISLLFVWKVNSNLSLLLLL